MHQITWDQTLSVQIDEIDQDHQRLVELHNLLARAVEEGEPVDYIQALLAELVSCTQCHFHHEERLMVKYGYDDMAEHRAEHDSLMASVRELQARSQRDGGTLDADDVRFLEQWLTGHILGLDMDLGAFLAETMD